ncbi:MAG: hypothetical protein ACE5KP_02685 [Dehalococcoidales bacterium]
MEQEPVIFPALLVSGIPIAANFWDEQDGTFSYAGCAPEKNPRHFG